METEQPKFKIKYVDHNTLLLRLVNYAFNRVGDRFQTKTIDLPIITDNSFRKVHFEVNDVTRQCIWFYIRREDYHNQDYPRADELILTLLDPQRNRESQPIKCYDGKDCVFTSFPLSDILDFVDERDNSISFKIHFSNIVNFNAKRFVDQHVQVETPQLETTSPRNGSLKLLTFDDFELIDDDAEQWVDSCVRFVNGVPTDVRFLVEGRLLMVHRDALVCSQTLMTLLQDYQLVPFHRKGESDYEEFMKHGVHYVEEPILEKASELNAIPLSDVTFEVMLQLLKAMYGIPVKYANAMQAMNIFIAAKDFQISFVENEAHDFIVNNLSYETVIEVLAKAYENYDDIIVAALSFIVSEKATKGTKIAQLPNIEVHIQKLYPILLDL